MVPIWGLCNIAWLRLEKGICRAKGQCGFYCRWVVGESLERALLGWQKGYVFAKIIHLKLRKTPFQRSLPFAIICNCFCPIPLLFSGHQVFIWLSFSRLCSCICNLYSFLFTSTFVYLCVSAMPSSALFIFYSAKYLLHFVIFCSCLAI